jgi:hypothetical protein
MRRVLFEPKTDLSISIYQRGAQMGASKVDRKN